MVLGLSPILQGASAFERGDGGHATASLLTSAMLVGIPAWLMKTKKSPAAIALLVLTGLGLLLGAVAWIALIPSEGWGFAAAFSLVVLFWAALTMQAWRALQAVRALPKLAIVSEFS